MKQKNYVGGQAVIEGVMMKNGSKIVTAVRDENGKIKTEKIKMPCSESHIPFIRGLVNLYVMLSIGYKSLNFSASVFSEEEESGNGFWMAIGLVFSLILAIFLFKFIPLGTASLFQGWFPLGNIWFNIIDGFVKILIFVLYVYFISLFKDIRRVFEYHGAEHKTVACYEAGEKLTVSNVKKYSTLHKRCGTTFIFFVLFVSIIVYIFIPTTYSFWMKLLLRLILLPVIAAISYEILRLGAKYKIFGFLASPGLWIQKITTREPDDKQIEVAIRALKSVL